MQTKAKILVNLTQEDIPNSDKKISVSSKEETFNSLYRKFDFYNIISHIFRINLGQLFSVGFFCSILAKITNNFMSVKSKDLFLNYNFLQKSPSSWKSTSLYF